MARHLIVLVLTAGLLFAGCGDDDEPRITKVTNDPPALSEKWQVLESLQTAYNSLQPERYAGLLDDNFVAEFFPGDVGGVVPRHWDVSAELESTREMLSRGGGSDDNAVLSITLQLANIETAAWQEVTPDQNEFPGETWYSTTVVYNFLINTTKDIQFITSGTPRAEFTVRQQEDETWRLVEWRDLANGGVHQASSATEETSWSRVKALYLEVDEYKDLSGKWHVLHNLKRSYNQMAVEDYVALLDDNFVSYFYAGDVDGGQVPEWWDVVAERGSAREMLGGGGGREDNPVLSISFSLRYVVDADWLAITPNPNDFPGETWYEATVSYNFFMNTTKDIQYLTSGSPRAVFTVRQQEDETWRLVEWRDLSAGGLQLVGAATEETSWGRVKALYQ